MQRIASFIRTAASLGTQLRTGNLYNFLLISNTFQNVVHKELLAPCTPMINQCCGFKVKGRVRRRCEACYFVVRDSRWYVICPKRPRHKQMAMQPKPHNTWILTHASQSKVRPW